MAKIQCGVELDIFEITGRGLPRGGVSQGEGGVCLPGRCGCLPRGGGSPGEVSPPGGVSPGEVSPPGRLGAVSSKLDEIVTFHQKPLSSKNTFIKNHFHPLSSKTTFIKNHFHQHPVISKITFIRKPLSSISNFIKNHFHQKPLSSKTIFINIHLYPK